MAGINPLVWRGVGALGGLLALIGALIAWATAPGFGSVGGTAFTQGEVVLALAIIALGGIAWRHLVGEDKELAPWTERVVPLLGVASVSRNSPHWVWVDRAVSVLGAIILVVTIVKWVSLEKDFGGESSIGAGIYLALVGSLVMIASGIPTIAGIFKADKDAADGPETSAAASTQEANSSMSAIDEIERLAGLLERGILTQEEFDAKKKQLLGL